MHRKLNYSNSDLNKLRRSWGAVSEQFFHLALASLGTMAYSLVECYGQGIVFVRDLDDEIRLVVTLSCWSPASFEGIAEFDVKIVLLSKAIKDFSTAEDPWMPGPSAKVEAYLQEHCMFFSADLSHLAALSPKGAKRTMWLTNECGLSESITALKAVTDDFESRLSQRGGLASFLQIWGDFEWPIWLAGARRPVPFRDQFLLRLKRAGGQIPS